MHVEAGSRGLSPTELQEGDAPDEVEALAKAVVKDGVDRPAREHVEYPGW
jgi:hypothetical protein